VPSCPDMKRKRRRKCLCCGDLYMPDKRNAHHQRYCRKAACRKASRQASQRRWLARPANRDYHCGAAPAARVRAWRQGHPGLRRRKESALQDLLPSQTFALSGLTTILTAPMPACGMAVAPSRPVPQHPAGESVAAGREPGAVPPDAAGAGLQNVRLQDLFLSQDPLFVGLIAMLTDGLQDDIGPVLAKLQTRGRAILGNGPGTVPKGAMRL
jgi:hypothetical protein